MSFNENRKKSRRHGGETRGVMRGTRAAEVAQQAGFACRLQSASALHSRRGNVFDASLFPSGNHAESQAEKKKGRGTSRRRLSTRETANATENQRKKRTSPGSLAFLRSCLVSSWPTSDSSVVCYVPESADTKRMADGSSTFDFRWPLDRAPR